MAIEADVPHFPPLGVAVFGFGAVDWWHPEVVELQ